MKEIFFGLGVLAAFAAAIIGLPLANLTLGPSANTVHACKELEMEGYLADECFDWDEAGYPWWMRRDCRRPKREVKRGAGR